jgi:4-hydroxy-tetrahydrodipicolinate synthase
MTAPRPASTFVISITPFDDAGRLDEVALRAHLRRLADAGIGVYLGGSGSGEGYTLTRAELRRVLDIGVDELRGRVPVRAMGVEPRTAAEMIDVAAIARDAGVDALQVYSLDQGHGNHPRPDELERYLHDVLDAVELPVVLSSHQSVGYFLDPSLIGRLLDGHDSIIGVNCTSPDLPYLVEVIDVVARTGARADVHVGGPMHALSCLALGGQGYLSSEGNLVPRLCVSLIDAHVRGDHDATLDAYARIMRIFTATRRLGGIAATKAALGLLGLPGGTLRTPRLPVAADTLASVAEMLETCDVRALEGIDQKP